MAFYKDKRSYTDLAGLLILISTFAGAFTLTTYFAVKCPESRTGVLLLWASLIFLASPLGILVIYLLLYGYTDSGDIPRSLHRAVISQFLLIGYMLELAFIAMPIAFYYYRNKLLSIGGLVLLTAMESSLFFVGNTTLLKGFLYPQPVKHNREREATQVSRQAFGGGGGGIDRLDDRDHVSRSHSGPRPHPGARPGEGPKAGDLVYVVCGECGPRIIGEIERFNKSGIALAPFDDRGHPPGSCGRLAENIVYTVYGPHERILLGRFDGFNKDSLAIIRFDAWAHRRNGFTWSSRTQADPRPHERLEQKLARQPRKVQQQKLARRAKKVI